MSDCNQCAETTNNVPYLVYESAQARNERTNKRLVIIIICLIIALLLTNFAWLYVSQQYDYETYAVDLSTDGGGDANYIGQDGEINNGPGESNTQNTEKEVR